MEFLQLATQRYSVRSYQERPVEAEKLDQLLRAAQIAPTAKNCQPFKIFVLQSQEALEKARQCSPLHYGAPLILLFCYDESDGFKTSANAVNFGLLDVSIVATHVMLQATELGLGTVWVCYFKPDVIKKEFELPENLEPVNILVVGYPNEESADINRFETQRIKMEQLVTFEKI